MAETIPMKKSGHSIRFGGDKECYYTAWTVVDGKLVISTNENGVITAKLPLIS